MKDDPPLSLKRRLKFGGSSNSGLASEVWSAASRKIIGSYLKHHAAFTNVYCRCSSEGGKVEVRLLWSRLPQAE